MCFFFHLSSPPFACLSCFYLGIAWAGMSPVFFFSGVKINFRLRFSGNITTFRLLGNGDTGEKVWCDDGPYGKDRAGRDGWVGVGDIEILLLRTTRDGMLWFLSIGFWGRGLGGSYH